MFCLRRAGVLLTLAAIAASAQSGRTPGFRTQPSLVFHEPSKAVILVDGTYPAVQPGAAELWSWKGERWERISVGGPPPRYASAAVYDSRRRRIVSVGGRSGKPEAIRGDTWEWDGENWRLMAEDPAVARDHPMMAYDADRGRTVLFGGGKWPRVLPWAADTWEWDGIRWSQVAATGPSGRVAAMVYDAARKVTVMFGGVGEAPTPGQAQPNFGDTWTWDGNEWRQAATAGPAPRDRHAMAFDSHLNTVLLYGGGTRAVQFSDMWKWDGLRWSEIPLSGPTPGPRSLHAMAYDPLRRRVVLYGGNRDGKVVDDTWEWDGRRWRLADPI